MSSVIVLNADNTYIGSISWQKSITLLVKGKVVMVKATDRVITNVSNSVQFVVPKVVRLIRFIKNVYKKSNVPYSKKSVFIRDQYTCQYCGGHLEKRECTVDHIKPKALGGLTSWTNCTTACTRCNNLKNDYPLDKNGKVTVDDGAGGKITLTLKKQPQRPSISHFLRAKSMDMLLVDLL